MKEYELTILSRGDAPEAEAGEITTAVKKLIVDCGGEIKSEHPWGRRALAYQILHQTHAFYTTWEFASAGPTIAKLERGLRLNPLIIRFLTSQAYTSPTPLMEETPAAIKPENESRTAEEQLRRTTISPKKAPVKKPTKVVEEDATARAKQVEEALSKILDDPEEK